MVIITGGCFWNQGSFTLRMFTEAQSRIKEVLITHLLTSGPLDAISDVD